MDCLTDIVWSLWPVISEKHSTKDTWKLHYQENLKNENLVTNESDKLLEEFNKDKQNSNAMAGDYESNYKLVTNMHLDSVKVDEFNEEIVNTKVRKTTEQAHDTSYDLELEEELGKDLMTPLIPIIN